MYDYSITNFEATVIDVKRDTISLNETYFYPGGGHQVNDTGIIICNGITKKVNGVFEEDGIIYHKIDSIENINIGDRVQCSIDKTRRKYLSTLHTAQHVISRIVFNKYKINTVTSELDINGGSIVFSSPLQPEWVKPITNDFDDIVKKEYEISNNIVEDIITVSIGDFDVENCCGTHLNNTYQLDNVFI